MKRSYTPVPVGTTASFSTVFAYLPPIGTPSGKRVYVWPGLNGDNSQWSTSPFDTLISNFTAAGHSVVEIVEPNSNPANFTNGGWQYRAAFNAAINTIMNAVEAQHGPVPKNIAGGASYGGLHSMMAFAMNGRFYGWWAHEPVTELCELNPEYAGLTIGEAYRFDPFFEVAALKNTKGWISNGTQDTRVNGQLCGTLMAKLGSVQQVTYDQEHETNAQNVTDISAWVNDV